MARLAALLQNSGVAANRQPMWADVATRAALLASAAADQPAEVRLQALGALRNLAVDDANSLPMWADAATRATLLAGAWVLAASSTYRERRSRST